MPEGEKLFFWGGAVVMVGIICPPPVGIGLTDLTCLETVQEVSEQCSVRGK